MTRRRTVWMVVAVLLLAAVAIRLLLPGIVRDSLNARMASMGDYTGSVQDVSLAIWRGAYRLRDLRIEKATGDLAVPLLEAPRVGISISWNDLLRGAVVAEVLFDGPTVHFVDGVSTGDSQAGTGVDWRARLADLVPIRIDEVRIRDGRVVFHNFVSDPPVNLEATQVQARIDNLTNVRDADDRRAAELEAEARLFDSADLEASARFDPIGRPDDFQFALRILDIELTRLNDLAQAYAALDFESGNGEFVMELEARDRQLSGYAKPLLQNLQIFSWQSDVVEASKNPFRIAWEAVAEGVTRLFRNAPADQFATRIEIRGELGDAELGTWGAILGILRNAFVEALQPYFEGTRLGRRPDSD
ncbi:MAG: DUF748 domain-containing protein [Xanthomonadales bacterium]|nr:DUF748 domain-containing protein [Xanthomonadales bacterium]